MKLKHTLGLVVLGLIFSLSTQAQSLKFGPTLSYQYLKGSTLKVGGMLLKEIDNNYLKFDLTANMTWTQRKFAMIPEFAASYYSAIRSWEDIIPCFVRAELTPYTVSPKIGISLLTVIELDFGYGFSIQHKKNYQPISGFAGSLRFNIPLNLFE